ncbi:hypothetical protein F2Q70_00029989 [Brassica cretica]|uniref:Uncharacterized protein n=1 Tax=Brassica cretica TaxID=69181 RepID=A0A8S9FIF3_BRACR|nr:hypothetical protein F2Q70_00029989 [Brassica cretica]
MGQRTTCDTGPGESSRFLLLRWRKSLCFVALLGWPAIGALTGGCSFGSGSRGRTLSWPEHQLVNSAPWDLGVIGDFCIGSFRVPQNDG